jgi:hypothetical protein
MQLGHGLTRLCADDHKTAILVGSKLFIVSNFTHATKNITLLISRKNLHSLPQSLCVYYVLIT